MIDNFVSIEMLLAWPLLLGALLLTDYRHKRAPIFLSYSYIAGLAVIHFPGAFAHALPWKPFNDSTSTIVGFEYSTIALAGFVLGSALVPQSRGLTEQLRYGSVALQAADRGHHCAQIMLFGGILAWIAEMSPLNGLPSITSLISAGKQLLIGGICLKCWLAWQLRDTVQINRWLIAAVALPVYTILGSGFLGFGISFLMTILIFVGTFFRPRWILLAAGAAAVFGGLSFFPAYLKNRQLLREAVWGEKSLDDRLEVFSALLSDLKPFDIYDAVHLTTLDARLNQNWLVGAAVNYVPNLKEYAAGETIYMALIALVPRAIWPDKPVVAGSMGMVTDYTGILFAGGTSVGMGQVMEFYVNFGTLGMLVCFMLLGYSIRLIDMTIARHLLASNWSQFSLWFLVGTATLQPIGQLLEITSSVAGAAVLGWAVAVIAARTGSKGRKTSTDVFGRELR